MRIDFNFPANGFV